jgi:hypothetical protein
MKQHPLVAYSSLIRVRGLHLILGGFAPPAHKHICPKDLPPPKPPSPRLDASFASAVWARLRKIYAALFSRAVAPTRCH